MPAKLLIATSSIRDVAARDTASGVARRGPDDAAGDRDRPGAVAPALKPPVLQAVTVGGLARRYPVVNGLHHAASALAI
jgi:hypothetical protein